MGILLNDVGAVLGYVATRTAKMDRRLESNEYNGPKNLDQHFIF